jgi:hypothetical protein
MSEMMILVRASIQASVADLAEYQAAAMERLQELDGFQGTSFWLQTDDPSKMLQVYEYASLEAAEQGLVRIVEGDLPIKSSEMMSGPADVIRMRVTAWHGDACQRTPLGSYLSLSIRTGDPGMGKQLDEDLEMVFGEMQVINGYIGAVRGCNDVLEEEIIGIALWNTEDAFRQSLPKKTLYEVKLYSKVL